MKKISLNRTPIYSLDSIPEIVSGNSSIQFKTVKSIKF